MRLGLRNEHLVIAISATSTLPLMQATAAQIVEARFAAGLVRSRSFFSTATQLPHILRPLLTQALRLAIARSDAWQQRRLMQRLQTNLDSFDTQNSFQPAEFVALFLPSAWIILILVREYI